MKMEWSRTRMPVMAVESCGYEGVRRIAHTVARDVGKVMGAAPKVVSPEELSGEKNSCVILCATWGKSPLLEKLAGMGLVDLKGFMKEDGSVKREVYQVRMISVNGSGFGFFGGSSEEQGTEDLQILLICGSDKRGTIYGMFSLSEYIGVSPLCYWGDVALVCRDQVVIEEDIQVLSKEPSVKYRGFFINDEWPCFGSWVTEHFGGFNAKAYETVFELLLRMKGNYLWPAMWTASFPLDGPGSENEELADLYGVVMGYSHHEPCLRASEEWDKVRGEGTRYGNEWNFYTNEEGLLHYWEDSLKRSGGYENIITIGMRGERDSSMLGPDATVSENINLLKDIITKQKELIGKHVKREGSEIPMLLALYKEVEPYFYGDEQTPGLKDWEGLDGVTCMLCEDNFGYVRTLPTEDIRNRRGGFGMYYHFDYHGAPISYEWVDCTPFSRIWEQMGQVYEYGIRDVWIVNVGDLKFHEVPLCYFLDIAYDFERWGYGNPDSCAEYTRRWVERNFSTASCAAKDKIGEVLTEYIRINSLRRPESLHAGIYHPCHYDETDRMLAEAEKVEKLSLEVMEELQDSTAYYSMIHYPAMASMNLLKMHLYAGKNHLYARQGRPAANLYGELARECIRKDREYAEAWGTFLDGKWNGMQMEQHIGFTRWNDDDYRYPVIMTVEPAHRARLCVSRKDDERIATKTFGAPMMLRIPDFQYAGCEKVVLEVANGGCGSLHYKISVQGGSNDALPQWLAVTPMEGDVETLQEVAIECRRALLPETLQKAVLLIEDGDARVAVEVLGRAVPGFDHAGSGDVVLPERTFVERNGVIAIGAQHFCRKTDTAGGGYQVMANYGKYGCGVKVFPSTAEFGEKEEKPEITYRFLVPEEGMYHVELITAPTNSLVSGRSVNLLVRIGDGENVKAEILPADYRGGDYGDGRWCAAALNQEHKTRINLYLKAGVQELTVGALEAGTILEKLLIYKQETVLPDSYLGPEESSFIGEKL